MAPPQRTPPCAVHSAISCGRRALAHARNRAGRFAVLRRLHAGGYKFPFLIAYWIETLSRPQRVLSHVRRAPLYSILDCRLANSPGSRAGSVVAFVAEDPAAAH